MVNKRTTITGLATAAANLIIAFLPALTVEQKVAIGALFLNVGMVVGFIMAKDSNVTGGSTPATEEAAVRMKPKRKRKKKAATAAVLLAVLLSASGCNGALGFSFTKPESPAQTLAYAEASVATANDTAAAAMDADVLTGRASDYVNLALDELDQKLDSAWSYIETGNAPMALDIIAEVTRTIEHINRFMLLDRMKVKGGSDAGNNGDDGSDGP